MKFEYILDSPCKINLSLDVHKRRSDGYHDLTSIFQLVSLTDRISAKVTSCKDISISGDFDCKLEDNLIFKAANLFLTKANILNGIDFKIDKKIPAGGGIGGGSSNCATVLRLLNYIYPNKFTNDELFEMGLSLGSDVPFFLGSGTALVEGRGEFITSLKTIDNYFILLVNPGIHISTSEAFSNLRKKGGLNERTDIFPKKITKEYYKGVNNFHIFKNSFEIALFSDYTFINDIKTVMNNEGSLHSALSGSGSTMFGIFKNREQAEKAIAVLSLNSLYQIFLVKPLDKYPEIVKRSFD